MKSYENESALIDLLIAGNANALQFVYEKNKNWIYNKVLSILHNEWEAEEVVQDIFIEIFESIGKFKRTSSLNTWIYRITLNKSFNRHRYLNAAKRKKEISLDESIFVNILPAITYSEGTSYDYPITFQQLLPFINNLEKNQRRAFILCMIRDTSYADAAKKMNVTIDSIRGLLHRAKQNIRTRVKCYVEMSNEPNYLPAYCASFAA